MYKKIAATATPKRPDVNPLLICRRVNQD